MVLLRFARDVLFRPRLLVLSCFERLSFKDLLESFHKNEVIKKSYVFVLILARTKLRASSMWGSLSLRLTRAIFDQPRRGQTKIPPRHDFGYKFVLASVHPLCEVVSHHLGLRFTYLYVILTR